MFENPENTLRGRKDGEGGRRGRDG